MKPKLFQTGIDSHSGCRTSKDYVRFANVWLAKRVVALAAMICALACLSGCEPREKVIPEKKPIPVEVRVLANSTLKNESLVTAPVASWKTEQIGMEVTGRIEWVVEPNSDIEGRVRDADDNLILEGTPIARIEKERYELQFQSAEAQVARAVQAVEAARIQVEDTLPAQVQAAEAEQKRAETEFKRSQRLVQQRAGAQSDVDRDEAAFRSAVAQIKQLEANIDAQKADLQARKAELMQAKDSLRDAERNLEKCTLYSSFRGQIASVAVVPGSVVTAGQPVATIQMMDPIKVEVEVSAEDSRRLRNRQRLPVLITGDDGKPVEKDGFLYLVDTVADPQKRTFTLTLLLMNQRITDDQSDQLPTIDQTWRVDFQFLPGADQGKLYVSRDAIYEDDDGPFIYRVDNMFIHGQLPPDRKLEVSKVPVELGTVSLPFLGNWIFQEVRILDEEFKPADNLICGKIKFPKGFNNGLEEKGWDGGIVLFQNEGQWMLRPGDLVKVDLSESQSRSNIYVPMDAVAYEEAKTYIFLISETASGGGSETDNFATVERVEVKVSKEGSDIASAMLPIEPVDSSQSLIGRRFVSRGAHYLREGEKVRPVEGEARE